MKRRMQIALALTAAGLAGGGAVAAAESRADDPAAELKDRIRSGQPLVPGFGLRGPGGHGLVHPQPFLDPAAEYLGVDEEELRERLAGGESLAEIAEAEGKSVEGLVDALV